MNHKRRALLHLRDAPAYLPPKGIIGIRRTGITQTIRKVGNDRHADQKQDKPKTQFDILQPVNENGQHHAAPNMLMVE
jgi:hypothetical protein